MSASQKFIARNRAPRVQIEYDVELYGAEKKVQLPFVMGVMSDLAGKSEVPQPSVADRKFLEIDVDNFDSRMKAMAPRAAFTVPNTLTGEGNLAVDITFESMDDFSPAAIARKVPALAGLLAARQELETLMTYMDGKAGAEALIERLLSDPGALAALSAADLPDTVEREAVLSDLRAEARPDAAAGPSIADVLDTLDMTAVSDPDASPAPTEILAALADRAPIPDTPDANGTAAALEALRAGAPAPSAGEDEDIAGIFSTLDSPPETPADADLDAVLASVEMIEETPEGKDPAADVLAGINVVEPQDSDPGDDLDAVLSGIETPAEPESPDAPDLDTLLSAIETPEEPERPDTTDAVLAGFDVPPEDAEDAGLDAVLASVETVEAPDKEDPAADVLAGINVVEPQDSDPGDDLDAVLSGIETPAEPEGPDAPDLDTLLSAIETPEEPERPATTDAVLAGLDVPPGDAVRPEPEDGFASLSAKQVADVDAPEETATQGALAGFPGEGSEAGEGDLDALLADLDIADAPEPVLAKEDVLATVADDDPTFPQGDRTGRDMSDADEALEPRAPTEDGTPSDPEDPFADLDALLAEDPGEDRIDALLDEIETGLPEESEDAGLDDLDALLASVEPDTVGPAETGALSDVELDALLDAPEEDEFGTMLAGLDPEPEPEETSEIDDLDAILAGIDVGDAEEREHAPDDALQMPAEAGSGDEADLDALLAGLDPSAETEAVDAAEDLDALLADLGEADANLANADAELDTAAGPSGTQDAFGTFGAARPDLQKLARSRFRIAVFGDFTGRAARHEFGIGEALAAREGVLLDPDSVEDIIESFATTLVLPIGADGASVEIAAKSLDDLHPDELFQTLDLFAELRGLRSQLDAARTAEGAAERLKAWGAAHGQTVRPPRTASSATAVRADLRLSDFQKLIGSRAPAPQTASPVEDLLARVVGPHVRRAPGADVAAMKAAVDEAIAGAMRLILHHPDFQALEAQWRTLDLLARSIEADDRMDVMLYDVSAEEIAADLAAQEDLSRSGLARLLTEGPLDEETGRGPFSALIGLYTFEETPPHGELLARVARIAAHVDAPFVSAITPGYVDVPMEDRHPLVAEAWDRLRGMNEAGHLGLASPRFLLRRPYGAKSEPIYEFDFEEFTMSEGLSGMLWGNPAALCAILMAQSFRRNGMRLDLGSVMSIGGMPYHFVTDRHGDQVALPCTERNFTMERHTASVQRGYMPLLSIKGRDEVRLGSFHSVGGGTLLGPWTEMPAPPPTPPADTDDVGKAEAGAPEDGEDTDLDFGGGGDDEAGTGGDDDLDALLAGFGVDEDDTGAGGGDGDIDADLEALLADL